MSLESPTISNPAHPVHWETTPRSRRFATYLTDFTGYVFLVREEDESSMLFRVVDEKYASLTSLLGTPCLAEIVAWNEGLSSERARALYHGNEHKIPSRMPGTPRLGS